MSGHSGPTLTVKEVPEVASAAPVRLSAPARRILWLLAAAGAATAVIGIVQEVRPVWISLQVNFVYWFCLSAALTTFGAVFQICNAEWARPVKRLFEAGSLYLAFAWLPLLALFFGKDELFVWVHEPIKGKEVWLSPYFLYGRDIAAMVVLALLGRRLVGLSVRRDREGSSSSNAEELTSKMAMLSPVMVIAYTFLMSLIAFDQIMSVDPHWYSTLFGAFYFMSGAYLALAWVCMSIVFVKREHPLLARKISPDTMHDLGKLLFGFGVFWAYLFWSHYLPTWYGNIPEFTGWVIDRLRVEPWHSLAWIVFGCCFVVPFLVGLSRDVKRIPECLFLLGFIVAVGLWLQMYLLFTPTLYPAEIPLGVHDVLITLGFAAAFILTAAEQLQKAPVMPYGDLAAA